MKHAEIKDKIIETASDLFYNNGYNSTGINQIISEAGIAKATLYNHFKSKEDICVSYIQYKNASFLEEIAMYCQSQPHGKEQVLAIFDFLKAFFHDKAFNGCWCLNTVSEIPKDNEKIRTVIHHQKNLFIEFISRLIEENSSVIIKENETNLARKIYLLYEGAVAESHLHQEEWPIIEAKIIASIIMQ